MEAWIHTLAAMHPVFIILTELPAGLKIKPLTRPTLTQSFAVMSLKLGWFVYDLIVGLWSFSVVLGLKLGFARTLVLTYLFLVLLCHVLVQALSFRAEPFFSYSLACSPLLLFVLNAPIPTNSCPPSRTGHLVGCQKIAFKIRGRIAQGTQHRMRRYLPFPARFSRRCAIH